MCDSSFKCGFFNFFLGGEHGVDVDLEYQWVAASLYENLISRSVRPATQKPSIETHTLTRRNKLYFFFLDKISADKLIKKNNNKISHEWVDFVTEVNMN